MGHWQCCQSGQLKLVAEGFDLENIKWGVIVYTGLPGLKIILNDC